MMSTNTMSGWWSAILESASKPSTAVKTSQPSFDSSVSAVRRMVLLSSMTSTFRPASRAVLVVAKFSIAYLIGCADDAYDVVRDHDTRFKTQYLAGTCAMARNF